jgi:hypothetical protein
MLTGGFLRQKWPKWHEHLVEECDALHVNEVLESLPPNQLATLWEWTIRQRRREGVSRRCAL